MNALIHDLHSALRGLSKAPGFAAVAILTLAFALGANTAIFSVVSAILLQPLPFDEPHELTTMVARSPQLTRDWFSFPNFKDIRGQARTIESMTAYSHTRSFLYHTGGEPEPFSGALVTADMWPMLGVKPILGRAISAEEDVFGQRPVVVIAHEMWQRQFGGDKDIIGRQIRLGATPKTIIGVMPRGFRFPVNHPSHGSGKADGSTSFWISLGQAVEDPSSGRGAEWMQVAARLRDGVTLEQANAEVKTIASRLEAQYAGPNAGLTFYMVPLHASLVESVRPALLVLMCAVGVVLLIGCANVANLLLARAAARHKEMSIRAAVGATRGRIIHQLLVESVLLSVVAGAIGLLLAIWGLDLLVALAPAEIPRLHDVSIDRTALLFTLGLSLLTGVTFGLAPALSASKTNLVVALKEGSRGSTEGPWRNRLRSALVVAEVALSVLLLVGAGLLLRSFLQLSRVDPGYDYRNALTVDLIARSAVFPKSEDLVQYAARAREELRAIPGVTAVSSANHLPLGGNEANYTFDIVGNPPYEPGKGPSASVIIITPDYFRTMGIPLLRGRPITDEDRPDGPKVMVVNDTFVRQHLGGQNAIGRQIDIGDGEGPRTIVGVAGDVRFVSLLAPAKPTFYIAHAQDPTARMQWVIRAPNAANLREPVRTVLRSLDREQPILAIRTLEEMRFESLGGQRFLLALIATLASLAVLLAAAGIYSVMSYMVTQRTAEIGIRMSLGAQARDIFHLILGQAVRLVLIGLALGIIAALAGTRGMAALLYGITVTDPLTFVSICFVIAVIALIASYVPVRRATRVDPLVAIRYD